MKDVNNYWHQLIDHVWETELTPQMDKLDQTPVTSANFEQVDTFLDVYYAKLYRAYGDCNMDAVECQSYIYNA